MEQQKENEEIHEKLHELKKLVSQIRRTLSEMGLLSGDEIKIFNLLKDKMQDLILLLTDFAADADPEPDTKILLTLLSFVKKLEKKNNEKLDLSDRNFVTCLCVNPRII